MSPNQRLRFAQMGLHNIMYTRTYVDVVPPVEYVLGSNVYAAGRKHSRRQHLRELRVRIKHVEAQAPLGLGAFRPGADVHHRAGNMLLMLECRILVSPYWNSGLYIDGYVLMR